ncbi:hypothetical protein A3Q56_01178 [Intoshia linei]|uniref:Uncharacterized protein n=1 Tax=Intoshia linei TaxID=1819745 RepID=A0A177B9R7_9BILA|nr:hypothetical protein A3Q56_01178 [Intoshia linei]
MNRNLWNMHLVHQFCQLKNFAKTYNVCNESDMTIKFQIKYSNENSKLFLNIMNCKNVSQNFFYGACDTYYLQTKIESIDDTCQPLIIDTFITDKFKKQNPQFDLLFWTNLEYFHLPTTKIKFSIVNFYTDTSISSTGFVSIKDFVLSSDFNVLKMNMIHLV